MHHSQNLVEIKHYLVYILIRQFKINIKIQKSIMSGGHVPLGFLINLLMIDRP